MTCSFCGSRNGDGEHRCRRCGRRPGDTLTGDTVLHPTQGQLAMQPRVAEAPPPLRPIGRAYQPSLFQQQGSNVIPIESYIPVEPRPKPQRTDGIPPKPRTPRRRPVPEGQGTLDFTSEPAPPVDFLASAPPKPRTLETTVEAVIFCDAPVAVWLHRAVAAALDWSMVLIGYGIFLLAFHEMGGSFALNKTTTPLLAAVLPLFGLVYSLIFAIAGGDTMGMHWTQLKLLTFDGYPPERRQRIYRVFGSALSLCTGIGSAWSLVDEECLAWQDHISRTFPTPRRAENLTLVRR